MCKSQLSTLCSTGTAFGKQDLGTMEKRNVMTLSWHVQLKKMHHRRKMPEQITINSLANSIEKGSCLTQHLLTANQFLKSWTKIYSGSNLVGCAHGDEEVILSEGMQSSQHFLWLGEGRKVSVGRRQRMRSCFWISVFSYLPLFGLSCYCLVFILKMSQNLWGQDYAGGCPATCDSWHPAEIAGWLIMPSVHGTALPSCETEQVLTNPSNVILSKTSVVMCSL